MSIRSDATSSFHSWWRSSRDHMVLAGMSAELEEAMMNEWGVVNDTKPKAKAKSYPGYRRVQ